MATTSPLSPTATVTTTAGVTHIDLNFSAAMAKGRGTIFVTDGAIQTVIDRVTGEPTLRVVGATVTREISLSQVSISGGTKVGFDVTGLAEGKHYNVYMGAGTLTSNGALLAGYTVPGQIGFDVAAALPPAVDARFSIDQTTLRAGQDIELLVTLSRAVTDLPFDAFSAENASILHVSTTEDPLTWKVVLTRSASLADAENVLTLDLSRVEIVPGVYGSGAVASPPYAVDTLVDPWITLAGSGRDTGASDSDNVVNSTAPYIRGQLHGGLDGDDFIELTINGVAVDPARIVVVNGSSPPSWYYAPDNNGTGPVMREGANTIVVRVTNAGHSSADYTSTIVVDTAAPEIAPLPDAGAGLPLNEDIVITFKEPLYWIDGESGTMPIGVRADGDDAVRLVYVDASAFLGGASTLSLDPNELGLAAGTLYRITLPNSLTDYAGNRLAGQTIEVRTAADATGPSALHVTVDGDLYYKAGETITFRIKFDEAVRRVTSDDIWLGLSNGGMAHLQSIDGDEAVFTYVVDDVDADIGDLVVNGPGLLVDNLADLAGNPLTAARIVFDGIEQYQEGYGYLPARLVVDTVAPEMDDSPDGAAGLPLDQDVVITFYEPLIWNDAGSGTMPISVYEYDEDFVRIVDVDAGAFLGGASALSLDPHELGLEPGKHYRITLPDSLTDYAGNQLAGRTIDFHTAPVADVTGPSALHVTVDGDLYYKAGETITFRIKFDEAVRRATNEDIWVGLSNGGMAHLQSIDGDEAVFTYRVDDVDADIGDLVVNDPGLLVDNIEDFSGNPLSGAHIVFDGIEEYRGGYGYLPVRVVVDTVADAPPLPTLDADSDSGVLGDAITNDRTPTLTGRAEAGARVDILESGVRIGGAYADEWGDWEAVATLLPGGGQHTLDIVQTDLAGNQSDPTAFVLGIDDHAAPLAAPVLANDTGVPSDRITSDATLRGGGAEANALIQIVRDGAVVGVGSAGADGNWTADFNVNPSAGAHTVAVRQVDQAGNIGALSPALTFTMQPPETVIAAAPQLTAASDTGRYDNDGITRNVTPTFTGSGAAPHSTIALFAGSREIGRVPTDAEGNWTVHVGPAQKFRADGSYEITSRPVGTDGVLGAVSQSMKVVIDTTAPRLTAFERQFKAFELQFGEQVFFQEDGEFRLTRNGQEREVFKGNDASNWSITDDGDTHMLTLRFNMNGTLHLSMQNANGVQDIAGNAAVIIGTPAWLADILV